MYRKQKKKTSNESKNIKLFLLISINKNKFDIKDCKQKLRAR